MKYDVYYDPINFYDENIIEHEDRSSHLDYTYSQCPVWGHMFDRTFVGYSPVDFSLQYDGDILKYQINEEPCVIINLNDIDEEYGDENIFFTLSDLDTDIHVIQLSFINSFFWTSYNQEYLWFEFLDHPQTFADNNFVAIGGWFNLANHPRTTSLGIKYEANSNGVMIERGDPLYRVRFYTDNMNDKPILKKKKSTDSMFDALENRREVLSEDSKFLKEVLFDKNLRGKCPYHDV
jgi:hypothetical protein